MKRLFFLWTLLFATSAQAHLFHESHPLYGTISPGIIYDAGAGYDASWGAELSLYLIKDSFQWGGVFFDYFEDRKIYGIETTLYFTGIKAMKLFGVDIGRVVETHETILRVYSSIAPPLIIPYFEYNFRRKAAGGGIMIKFPLPYNFKDKTFVDF